MRRCWTNIAAVIGVIVAITATATSADAPIGASPVANTTDQTGQRVWWGESSPELDAVADLVESGAAEQPDLFAGTALTSDRSRLEVYYMPAGAEELRELRTAVGSDAFDQYVVPVQVRYSLVDLLTEQQVIAARLDQQAGAVSVGPSFTLNALTVGIHRERLSELSDREQLSRGGRASDATLVALGLSDVSSGVPIFIFPDERPES